MTKFSDLLSKQEYRVHFGVGADFFMAIILTNLYIP